jgi:hypothetical protein
MTPQNTPANRVKHGPADHGPNTDLRLLLEQMVEETANRIIAQRKEVIETGTAVAKTLNYNAIAPAITFGRL